jgi:hypothetical protein
MIRNSGERRAVTAAAIFAAISPAGTTTLPSMCPHLFGIT